MRSIKQLLLCCCLASWCCASLCLSLDSGEWKSCASVTAAFDIQAVNLQPNVVSPGGTLNLLVDVNNKQAPGVTAGSATVKVYYYGWWVLTASGTMCEGPPATMHTPASPSSSTSSSSSRAGTAMQSVNRRALQSISSSSDSASRSWWNLPGHSSSSSSALTQVPHQHPTSSAASTWGPVAWGLGPPAAVSDGTCMLPAGPLQLHHEAALPRVAPRGNYRMQLSAADAVSGQELLCVDVWFKVA